MPDEKAKKEETFQLDNSNSPTVANKNNKSFEVQVNFNKMFPIIAE